MKIAIIPARGGSKRIHRKNIKNFYGKPIIEYGINAALESRCFDKVVVSTDDDEIAQVASRAGAEIPFIRPANISDDFSTTADVIKHAINWFKDRGNPVEHICCIYPTAPFLLASDILESWNMFKSSPKKEYIFSVTSFPFPIQRGLYINKGVVKAIYPEHSETRSQDLPEAFHDAGLFYWGSAKAYLSDLPLFSESSLGYQIPRSRVQDIDTLEDWNRAEVMFKVLQELKK